MDQAAGGQSCLFVILDPDFGEKLKQIPPGQPVWIATSPANDLVISELWASAPNGNHLTGITGMSHYHSMGREGQFLEYLDTIDLHHGPHSTEAPYTVLKVIGMAFSERIREALAELGFTKFSDHGEGFEASRTPQEAARLRQ